mmetsp:Transcript_23420/g.60260  ORF Transcript_23420/g.60260 Transcript_23420/m.60260 type:complete len:163 (+) Transcript_23420:17-505(+)
MAPLALALALMTAYAGPHSKSPALPRAMMCGHSRRLTAFSSAPLLRLPPTNEPRSSGGNDSIRASEATGKYIFVVTLLAIIWGFTLPPEIRRTKMCTTDNPKVIKFAGGCSTPGEIAGMVRDHYKTCTSPGSTVPCVKLDLSIDPKTKEFNRNVLRARGFGA